MKRTFEAKKIVIWGVGVLQADIEAIYHLNNIIAYIDDVVEDKDLVNVTRNQVASSREVSRFADKDTLFILCTKDKDYAIRKLVSLGLTRENYVLAEELLTDKKLLDLYCSSDITIYGAGKTYLYWKNEIDECKLNLQRFAVTHKDIEEFDGKEVIDLDELKQLRGKTKVIVSSIYYGEIFNSLTAVGFIPGKDFLQLDTFLLLHNLSENINSNYAFTDRSSGSKVLLVILSGYKDLVWDSVFGRIERFCPGSYDVCIVTSGKNDQVMSKLCEKNSWSYLSTEINNVSLAINLATALHPKAEYIIKMDEDIFVTKGTFETLLSTYDKVEKESDYEVGFVTPLIPVNGYGYARVLDILGIRKEWEERFGEIKITDCYKHHMTIHDSPEAAEFLWGKDNPPMKSIDLIQKSLQHNPFSYSICPVRYSIGLIVFNRENWLRMGMFPVKSFENMGADEKRICKFCLMEGRAMVVSENCIVGHLSYGPQHKVMETYYKENKKHFDVEE